MASKLKYAGGNPFGDMPAYRIVCKRGGGFFVVGYDALYNVDTYEDGVNLVKELIEEQKQEVMA